MNPSTIQPSKSGLFAWCLYDWACSAYPTLITTFIFATYFTEKIASDSISGTAQWGQTIAISGIVIALISPLLGAVADYDGRRKPWLIGFSLVCAISASLLWYALPSSDYILWTLLCIIVGTICIEIAFVFYNAMLKDLAPKGYLGRLSGWGWGLGYIGGLACLAIALLGFVQPDTPWFGLDKATYEHIRVAGPLVAVWLIVFSIPLTLLTPDAPATGIGMGKAMKNGYSAIRDTLKLLPSHKDVFKFLIARMLYIDGLNTLFVFGGVYAAGTFGMSIEEVILFGIGMNVTAGIGAAIFGFLDDFIGPKKTILIALIILLTMGIGILFVEDKNWFWCLALIAGSAIGPTQAASRSLMAKLSPSDHLTGFFGLYAFSGKATAFLGPWIFGLATLHFQTQRAGMATVMLFLLLGGALLLLVKEEDKEKKS